LDAIVILTALRVSVFLHLGMALTNSQTNSILYNLYAVHSQIQLFTIQGA